MSKYGRCEKCRHSLEPHWFIEDEYDVKHHRKTGRTRRAVSHLECPNCLTNFVVDDSFDCEWK